MRTRFVARIARLASFAVAAAWGGGILGGSGILAASVPAPAYHLTFDGNCEFAEGSESFTWGGTAPDDAQYFRSTRTGGKALKVVYGSAHPWVTCANNSPNLGNQDWTILCSARIAPKQGAAVWAIGTAEGAHYIALTSQGIDKVALADKDNDVKIAVDVEDSLSKFHSYAVVVHYAEGTADLYVDGAYAGSASVERGSWDLQIGSVHSGQTQYADGTLIDDWQFHRTALTADEIAAYAEQFPAQPLAADNMWIATEQALWSDGANWSTGAAPGTGDVVEIPAGADIRVDSDKQVDEIILTGGEDAAATQGDGEAAFLSNGNGGWRQIRANVISRTGDAAMVLKSWWYSGDRAAVGLESSADMFVDVPVILRDITNGDSTRAQDVWVKNYSGNYVYLLKPFTVEAGAYLRVYDYAKFLSDVYIDSRLIADTANIDFGGRLHIGKDAWAYFISNSTVSGTLVVDEGDSLVSGQIRLQPASGTADITQILTGTIELNANATIRLPAGMNLRKVKFADGAKLFLTAGESETVATIAAVELPDDGSTLADHLIAIDSAGARTAYTIERDEETGVVTATQGETYDSSTPVRTVWVGGSSTDWWNASNWSLGVPTEIDTAVFPCDAHVTPGDVNIRRLEIADGCTVKFHRAGRSGWPTLRLAEAEGGTINLSCQGLKPLTSLASGESATVRSDIVTDPTNAGADQDCWIEGNDGGAWLDVYGTLYATNSAFRVNQNMRLYGTIVCGYTSNDDNYLNNSTVKAGGKLLVVDGGYATINTATVIEEGGTLAADAGGTLRIPGGATIGGSLSGEGGFISFAAGATVNGNITGSPVILANGSGGDIYLNGNNEEFAGAVTNLTSTQILHFENENAASPKAFWHLEGDVRSSVTSGTLKFGALEHVRAASNNWCVFYFPDETETVADGDLVIEVGARGDAFEFGKDCWFDTSGTHKAVNVRIRKVGESVMTFGMGRGGVLELAGGATYFTATEKDLPATVELSGGAIGCDGEDVSFAGAITGAADLVKKGDGTLTLTQMPQHTGNTTVAEGTLIVPIDTAKNLGELSVAEGAHLYVDGASLEVSENVGVDILAATAADAETLARIGVANSDWNWACTFDQSVITATPSAWGDIPNVWVGGAEGSWNVAANWSRNVVPTAEHTAMFTSDAVVAMSQTGSNPVGTLALGDGRTVELRSSDIAGVHPSLDVATAVTGSGTIRLYHAGIRVLAGAAASVEIPETVAIEFLFVTNNSDSWLEGNGDNHLVLKGPLKGSGYAIFRQGVDVYGSTEELVGTVGVRAEGATTFYTVESTLSDCPWHFTSTASPITFKTAATGIRNTWTFDVNGNSDVAAVFEADTLDGESASWVFNRDVVFENHGSVTAKFGKVTATQQKMAKVYPDASIVVEIGALGGTSDFGTLFFFGRNPWGVTDKMDVTVKKVGDGVFVNALYGVPVMIVEAGEMQLAESGHGDERGGHWGIDSITVKAGAVLSGTTNQDIGELILEPGAIIRQTLTRTADEVEEGAEQTYTYSCPVIAASGTVGLDGVLFDMLDPDGYLTALRVSDRVWISMLTATEGFTGTPLPYRKIESATANWQWQPRYYGTTTYLRTINTKPGFYLKFR